ncbi:hypothetical protein [Streptomyces sp. bgisy159]|uniref:hypothetical protein n=1 Tax=Streptomyces sp. bgisy159 TaxID=3413795 RepID=UPI003F4A07B0
MDLTGPVLRVTAARPRVLTAPLPGSTAVRLAAEREVRRRGWATASTPADADLLLVLGTPVSALTAAVDRLARDIPAPRATVRVATPREVAAALDTGRSLLTDPTLQRRTVRAAGPGGEEDDGGHGDGGDDDGGDDGHGGEEEHGAPENDDHGGHEGHGGHGGHGGDMDMPGGLPMADQAEDRDGLTLDRLHFSLGPLLGDWPTALTVRLAVQGDVIQEAEVDPTGWADADRPPGGVFWNEPWERAEAGGRVTTGQAARRRAACRLDSVARLLAVAGWPAQAVRARRLRDALLAGAAASEVAPGAARLARRVGRSRVLYWLTHGIAPLSRADARAAGVYGPAADADGDVPARYRAWLAAVEEDVARLDDGAPLDPRAFPPPRGPAVAGRPPSAGLVRVLPGLLRGAELAAARLTVASLDPDVDELIGLGPEVTDG